MKVRLLSLPFTEEGKRENERESGREWSASQACYRPGAVHYYHAFQSGRQGMLQHKVPHGFVQACHHCHCHYTESMRMDKRLMRRRPRLSHTMSCIYMVQAGRNTVMRRSVTHTGV